MNCILTDELKERMIAYLEDCPNQVPSISGMIKHLDISRSVMYHWKNEVEDPFVTQIMEKIAVYQEVTLIDKGLNNTFNPAITKMLLTRHGYADKTETDVTSGGQQLNAWTVQPVTTNTDR